jgi:hypothetical protein
VTSFTRRSALEPRFASSATTSVLGPRERCRRCSTPSNGIAPANTPLPVRGDGGSCGDEGCAGDIDDDLERPSPSGMGGQRPLECSVALRVGVPSSAANSTINGSSNRGLNCVRGVIESQDRRRDRSRPGTPRTSRSSHVPSQRRPCCYDNLVSQQNWSTTDRTNSEWLSRTRYASTNTIRVRVSAIHVIILLTRFLSARCPWSRTKPW